MPSTCEATVFYDDAGEASARIYALAAPTIDGRLLTVDELAECRLECRVEGPKCRYSTTLPTRVKLTHRGVTNWGDLPALVAETFLPDPCPWSPELPFLYRVIGEVRLGERVIAEVDQTFGIRPISAVRKRIVLHGKTWVPRGVGCVIRDIPMEVWRETATTVLDGQDDAKLQEASEVGVTSVAFIHGAGEEVAKAARRMSCFPSVVMIHAIAHVSPSLVASARNTLFISDYNNRSDSDQSQVDFLYICPPDAAWSWPQDSSKPVIAFRPAMIPASPYEARAACDTLQADMAGKCDPAGYFV